MNDNIWNGYEEMNDAKITFNLYSEGKSLDLISKIRNMDKGTVQKHLIEFKMKNRYTARIKSPKDIFKIFANTNKNDKLKVLNSLEDEGIKDLLSFINKEYRVLNYTDKTTAAWIIGELKAIECIEVLKRASVHNAVSVRRMAVSAMGKIQEKSMVRPLVRALADKNDQVVVYAINALRKLEAWEVADRVAGVKGQRKDYVDRAVDSFVEEMNGRIKV